MKARLFPLALVSCFLSVLLAPPAEASRFGMMRMNDAQERELAAWFEGLDLYEPPADYKPVSGEVSVLDHLHYTPRLREQTPTGTCWIWASTAMMSIYFDRQFDGDPKLQEGLSVQFLASNAYMVGSNLNAGGHVGKTKAFYDMVGYAIPSSNTGALWDTEFAVGETRPYAIASGTPWSGTGDTCFPIESIDIMQVRTWDVAQAEAVKNLKSVLDAGYPVGLLYFLPTTKDWDVFDAFWVKEPVDKIIDMDYAKGHEWDMGGCGHWVVLVGYNDSDPDPKNHYWVLLNTHSSTVLETRPDVTFRMSMYVDYGAQFTGNPDPIPYLYNWVVMETRFAGRNSPAPPKGLESVSVGVYDLPSVTYNTVTVSGATFSDTPSSIGSGRLTLNFLEIPLDSSTGYWRNTGSGFRFDSKAGVTPSVEIAVDTSKKTWSARVKGQTLTRYVNSANGLAAKIEYREDVADAPLILLSQRGAVADRVKTLGASSVKGP